VVTSPSRPAICVIGAGPYGVTIAAHLKYFGIDFRIFGSPMRRWLSQMPKRMFLKSEGCASSLYDPAGDHTLERYCSNEGLPYLRWGAPISRELFAKYAVFFQQKLVPNVEDVKVLMVGKLHDGFDLRLSNGEILRTGKVIVATGLENMAHIPDQLAGLPTALRSHSSDHFNLSVFKEKEVVVIGGGQSGLETAALLCEEGASVSLLVRKPSLEWHPKASTAHRSIYERLRSPRTRLGDGRNLWIYDNIPGLFHCLPQRTRLTKVAVTLGPAGAGWLKDRVVERVPILLAHHLRGAAVREGRVLLQVADQNGQLRDITTDHVIAATGYRFNTHHLPFLSQNIKSQLRYEQQSPLLSSNFESSVPGLYFSGPSSANSFGPAMRFLAGASYTARRVSLHVARGQGTRGLSVAQRERCPEF
jgi:cation diffusion facilitator CzcD-associated flavoprotein CzcO